MSARTSAEALHAAGACGLRCSEVSEAAILAALAAHASLAPAPAWQELTADHRARITAGPCAHDAIVVKEYRARGLTHRLADLFRGSPAQRAWRGALALRAKGIAAARPIAYLEWRRFGLPERSIAIFEDLRPDLPADACPPEIAPPGEIVTALLAVAVALHRHGASHGDLKASHVYLRRDGAGLSARLIDLDGVRFPRRLRDRDRIRELAELNASLPDEIPASARCRAFADYARVLPFRSGNEAALRAIVTASLARRHRWTGRDCELAREPKPAAAPGPISD